MLTKSINTESRDIRKQSNQELNNIKAELMKDKKAITRTERYELEARLQTHVNLLIAVGVCDDGAA